MRALLLFLLAVSQLRAGQPSPAESPTQSFVIGISPFLPKNVKDDVYRGLVRLLVRDLPLNSSISFYDAYQLRTITQVTLPKAAVFESSKTRANQFAPAIGELKRFLAAVPPRPAVGHLTFDAALRLPQFCDFLAENLPAKDTPQTVLLIGSPLYQDAKEPDFSMVDGYFPSDGHLQATRERSVFGVSNRHTPSLIVHWIYFGDPWMNDLYREKVNRFWALYLEQRGARLATFCADLPTALTGFQQGLANASEPTRRWTLDPQQTKIEMLRIGREVELTDWIQRDTVSEAQHAPSVMFGPMKIGIRWKGNIDLDLYSSPRPEAETLFFQHPRSAEGYYYKDHRSSPGREYEFIEFETPVDVRKVEAFVNFYKGECPRGPRGEVRIEFDGKIYSASFAIEATSGNRGRAGSGQDEFWTRIPVPQILKLSPL